MIPNISERRLSITTVRRYSVGSLQFEEAMANENDHSVPQRITAFLVLFFTVCIMVSIFPAFKQSQGTRQPVYECLRVHECLMRCLGLPIDS